MSGDSVVDKALDLGTMYFKSENYSKAKDLFTKAIKLAYSYEKDRLVKLREELGLPGYSLHDSRKVYHPKLVKLYDNLSASWERMGSLDKAYLCSQKMVHVEPYNLKGYIRMGKVLQRQNKDKEAYKCYKKGLVMAEEASQKHNLKVSEKFVCFIEKQKEQIKERHAAGKDNINKECSDLSLKRVYIDPVEEQRHLNKKNKLSNEVNNNEIIILEDEEERAETPTVDFIASLPLELMPRIFANFTSREILKCSLISKDWNERIFSYPHIFKRFNLSSTTYRQILKFLQFFQKLNKFKYDQDYISRLQTIRFSSRTASEELKSLSALIQSKSKITCQKLILSVPNSTTGHLIKFLNQNSDIGSNLQELSAVISLRIDKPYEIDIISKFHELKRVEMIIVKSVVPINSDEVQLSENFNDITIPKCAQNLDAVRIICDEKKVNSFPFLALLKGSTMLSLTKLCITGVTLNNEANQFDWLQSFRNLKEIWFENNKVAKLQHFLSTFRRFPLSRKLEKLTFRENLMGPRVDIHDLSGGYYEHNFQYLQELDLMGSSIGGESVLNIVTCIINSSLKKLNIGDCPHIRFSRSQNNDHSLLPLSHLLLLVPDLRELRLPQFGSLCDNSVALLTEHVQFLASISYCDLSMNPSLTGAVVYEFLRSLKESRGKSLEKLNIDGCPLISHITNIALKSQKLVSNVECTYERETWRIFGVNSYKYSST